MAQPCLSDCRKSRKTRAPRGSRHLCQLRHQPPPLCGRAQITFSLTLRATPPRAGLRTGHVGAARRGARHPQASQPAAPGEAMLRSERHRRAAPPAREGWTRRETAAGHGWRSAREPSGAKLPHTRPPQPVSRSALNEHPVLPARGARPRGKGRPKHGPRRRTPLRERTLGRWRVTPDTAHPSPYPAPPPALRGRCP